MKQRAAPSGAARVQIDRWLTGFDKASALFGDGDTKSTLRGTRWIIGDEKILKRLLTW